MVQKSSALIVVAIGLSAVTMAVPIPAGGGLLGFGARFLTKGGGKALTRTASRSGTMALERTASMGGSSLRRTKSTGSSLSRLAHATSKGLPGALDNANSAMNLYQTYQFSKPQAQPQQQPMDDGSGYQGREFDDTDILERDVYDLEELEARSPVTKQQALHVAGKVGNVALTVLPFVLREYEFEELD